MEVPSLSIMLWSRPIAAIPPGWLLCDGNNGTPDLRNRFLICAGDTYSRGDTGGAVNHNHDFTGDGHTHDLQSGDDIDIGNIVSATTTLSVSSGTTDNGSSLPPYFSLAYIMKS